MEPDVRAILTRLLQEIAGIEPDAIRDEATIDGDLELNSVTFVELQVALEDDLDIVIDPVEVVDRNRLGAIVDYLETLVAEQRA